MGRWERSTPNTLQKLFVHEEMKTSNATEAWMKVYKNTNRNSSAVMASRTLRKPHIIKFRQQEERRIMKKSDITIEKVLSDLQWAVDMGKSRHSPTEVVAAANAQAKLVGLLRDRVETGQVGEFGDTTSIEGILEIVAKEAGPEAAMTLATMFG